MKIIGAGLTGLIAAYAFKDAEIHEYLNAPRIHKAVLRFRSPSISELTGIPFKKVTVHKAVAIHGRFVTPNLQLMNQYSFKVTGGYYERSIGNLDPVTRYIAPEDFHQQMFDAHRERIVLGSQESLIDMETPVISTLPLSVLVKEFGIEVNLPESALASTPIYVTTIDYDHCDLYQTVYFPVLNTPVYRASMTGSKLIIEAMGQISKNDVYMVQDTLGLPNKNPEPSEWCVCQKIGKFHPLEENYRKHLMYEITSSFGIYSLGRHATWRKILLDDVACDIDRIKSMIRTSLYDRMLGKMK